MLSEVRNAWCRQSTKDAVARAVAPSTAALLGRSINAAEGARFASMVAEEPLTSLQQQVPGG